MLETIGDKNTGLRVAKVRINQAPMAVYKGSPDANTTTCVLRLWVATSQSRLLARLSLGKSHAEALWKYAAIGVMLTSETSNDVLLR